MFGYDDSTARERYDVILDNLDAMYDNLKSTIETKEQQIDVLEDRVDRILEDAMLVSVKLADQTEATNRAYTQRAIAAVAFAHTVLALGGTAGIGRDNREDQPDNWRVVLYVDTPAGQLSWHIAPNDQAMIQGLPNYTKPWDGTYNSSNVAFYKDFLNA